MSATAEHNVPSTRQQRYACALGHSPRAAPDQCSNSACFRTSKYSVAHERQHAKDFDDLRLEANFKAELGPFLSAPFLKRADKDFIWRLMWELRGHQAAARQALADLTGKVPHVDDAGAVRTGPAAKDNYDEEISRPAKEFSQMYQQGISQLLTKIEDSSKGQAEVFAKALQKFELTHDPKNPVGLRKFVKGFEQAYAATHPR